VARVLAVVVGCLEQEAVEVLLPISETSTAIKNLLTKSNIF